jgi:dTDP-4-amino-4,6-dideoxygalactose transaminase
MLSIGYVVNAIAAYYLLGEQVTPLRFAGIGVIIVGVFHRRALVNKDFLPFTRPSIDEATIAGVAEVLRSGWITTGPQARAFEAALSEHCGGRPVRVYSSGTITMEIALRLAGVGPGDEVLTTPLTWVSTANVVLEVGARPVFVDVDPKTRNIDLSLVEAKKNTKAIIPVDLAGTARRS